jgi:rod shape-determining protein MreC
MKQFFRNNGVLILVAAVLLAALLAVGSFLLGNDPVADALGVVTTPFRSLSTSAAEWVQDWYDRAFQYDTLGEANEELRARLAELEGLERDYQDAIRQNEQYRELLGLAEKRSDFVFEQAEITQRSTSSWERTVTLNKGSKHGVEVDDCVVDEYGNLMGIVTQVDYNSCVMAAIVDAEVELGGRVARTDENAILEGDFTLMLEGKLKLSYLTEDSQLISGDQITTSGLGLVYPAGLVVGTIESIHTEANGLDRYAVVRPAADLDGQRYVFIIKDFEVVE